MRRLAIALLTLTLAAAGCDTLGVGPQPIPANAAELARLVYPVDSKYGPPLDIVAVRHGHSIELVNRTPTAYMNMQLWLNQQWVLPVHEVAIGSGGENNLPLGHFVDEHARPYPLGGLLTPDRDQQLIMAELYDPAKQLRYPILVRNP